MDPTYTGAVTPRGVPDVRQLEALTITKYAVDPQMANNCYFLTCRATGATLLVDAADEAESLIQLCDGALETVVTTHQHWDHHRALAEVVSATGATTVAGTPDGDDDVITVGEVPLQVIAIAGHTPGSICLLYDDPAGHPHLFTGDSLFPGGVGATFGDADAFATLIDQVSTKIFDRLPDSTWFYPGHGNDSTLGAERPSLPEWRARGW